MDKNNNHNIIIWSSILFLIIISSLSIVIFIIYSIIFYMSKYGNFGLHYHNAFLYVISIVISIGYWSIIGDILSIT